MKVFSLRWLSRRDLDLISGTWCTFPSLEHSWRQCHSWRWPSWATSCTAPRLHLQGNPHNPCVSSSSSPTELERRCVPWCHSLWCSPRRGVCKKWSWLVSSSMHIISLIWWCVCRWSCLGIWAKPSHNQLPNCQSKFACHSYHLIASQVVVGRVDLTSSTAIEELALMKQHDKNNVPHPQMCLFCLHLEPRCFEESDTFSTLSLLGLGWRAQTTLRTHASLIPILLLEVMGWGDSLVV